MCTELKQQPTTAQTLHRYLEVRQLIIYIYVTNNQLQLVHKPKSSSYITEDIAK